MKQINIFSIIAAFIGLPVLFSSCEDVLDKKPLDLIAEDDVWMRLWRKRTYTVCMKT